MVVQAQGDTEGTYISNGGTKKLVDGEYCAIARDGGLAAVHD